MKQYIPNPSNPQSPRPVHLLTDRALRYRANSPELRPAMPKICAYCGGRRNVEVEHIDGHEEHLAPDNLIWACRSCNTKKGLVFKNAGLGRRTRQYNPTASGAQNLAQWLQAVMATK